MIGCLAVVVDQWLRPVVDKWSYIYRLSSVKLQSLLYHRVQYIDDMRVNPLDPASA